MTYDKHMTWYNVELKNTSFKNMGDRSYRVFIKNCVYSQFIATHPLHVGDRLVRVYSHSYWLAISWTTNNSPLLARERLQSFENSWQKTQYLMNTLYNTVHLYSPVNSEVLWRKNDRYRVFRIYIVRSLYLQRFFSNLLCSSEGGTKLVVCLSSY